MTQLSDEILVALGDGELGPAQVRAVDKVFAADPETQRRYQALLDGRARLLGAFSSMLQADAHRMVAAQVSKTAAQTQSKPEAAPPATGERGGMMIFVALAVLLLAAGGTTGYFLARPSTPAGEEGFAGEVREFWSRQRQEQENSRSKGLLQRHASPDTTGAVGAKARITMPHETRQKWFARLARGHANQLSGLLGRFEGRSRNRELALFELSGTGGVAPDLVPVLEEEKLTFVGAEPLQSDEERYVRLVYQDRQNNAVPIGLYVAKARGGSLTLQRGYLEDQNYVYWTQGTRRYMLIGAVPHWRLIVLSVAVQRQLVR